jgi:tellurite resistance protein TerC
MADLWSRLNSAEFVILVGFHIFILLMLILDLGILRRNAHTVSMKEAAIWSAVWIGLAMLFTLGIWRFWHVWVPDDPEGGSAKAVEFLTGYLIEKSLSVDNLFVFLVIFRYFGVPAHLQHRILNWGILGALVMRSGLILIGAALLSWFSWMIYVFGAFLIYTAYRLARSSHEDFDPSRNPLLRFARRLFPVVDDYNSPHFWVKRAGRWHATPLPLVLLVVESTDVLFAVDSIPAIFGVTRDAFIVYTSNVFAILGLRALYFLLAGFLGMFRYLSIGLSLVLAFVGLKMIVEEPLHPYLKAHGIGTRETVLFSLGVIALILGGAVIASLIAGPKEPLEELSEAVEESSETAPDALEHHGDVE